MPWRPVRSRLLPPPKPSPGSPEWTEDQKAVLKHDGYRALLTVDHGEVRAFNRNGLDWTRREATLKDRFASSTADRR